LLAPGPTEPDEGIGTLAARLVEDGRTLLRAELDYARQTALLRLARSRTPLILIGAALLLAIGSAAALMVGLMFWLAFWIGPVAATLAVTVAGFVVAGLMVRVAAKRLAAAATAPGEVKKAGRP
jgi:hypothetical protein